MHFDAIVVGLGAMGSSALYQLGRRGRRVLGVEAFAPGHRQGSSHGESRIIRLAYYEHPSYVPLLRRAYSLWADLERESGEQLLRITGGLMIGAPDSELVVGATASAVQHQLEYELLDAREVRRRYPALHLQPDEVALFEPRAGILSPERCVETHVRLARAAGAETRYGEPVQSWTAGDAGVELVTPAGRYTADQVVFTCGAWMSQVVGDPRVQVRAERIPLFWLQPAEPDLFEPGRLPVYLWQQPDGDHFYGFPHLAWPGVKVARHHSHDDCDPNTVDRQVNTEDERRLRASIADRLPALDGPVVSRLVCLYENSPDGHFLIDRLPDRPGVIFAGGFSGHGFKFASVVGEILADLVTRGYATADADFLKLQLKLTLRPSPTTTSAPVRDSRGRGYPDR
jgi:sarcosine oxidase